MRVGEAQKAAREWVRDHAGEQPGYAGAYLAGSTTWLADDDVLPVGTDVDVMVVVDGGDAPQKPGKFAYHGALLEVTFVAAETLRSPEVVLSDYHLAPGFRASNVIADPSGTLTRLRATVGPEYTKRRWVRARAENARGRIEQRLDQLDPSGPFPDQVLGWLFPTGVTTHVLLVAGLHNPTVRRRYVAVHDLLVQYGRIDFYVQLLELLGCAHLTRARVERHLAALTLMFDAAAPVASATPFFFASDLSVVARPIAIDASRVLIEHGQHREAMFWIAATASRCQKVLQYGAAGGPNARFEAQYREIVADFGITDSADLRARADATLAMVPEIWSVAEQVMAANPDIRE